MRSCCFWCCAARSRITARSCLRLWSCSVFSIFISCATCTENRIKLFTYWYTCARWLSLGREHSFASREIVNQWKPCKWAEFNVRLDILETSLSSLQAVKTMQQIQDRVESTYKIQTHAVLLLTVTLTLTFQSQNHSTGRISQDHSLYQVWTLWDHSFLHYAVDKQTDGLENLTDKVSVGDKVTKIWLTCRSFGSRTTAIRLLCTRSLDDLGTFGLSLNGNALCRSFGITSGAKTRGLRSIGCHKPDKTFSKQNE